ncbi:hypothetical protein C8J57DRAFT_636798, partial [Mycena rebaudengoi]
ACSLRPCRFRPPPPQVSSLLRTLTCACSPPTRASECRATVFHASRSSQCAQGRRRVAQGHVQEGAFLSPQYHLLPLYHLGCYRSQLITPDCRHSLHRATSLHTKIQARPAQDKAGDTTQDSNSLQTGREDMDKTLAILKALRLRHHVTNPDALAANSGRNLQVHMATRAALHPVSDAEHPATHLTAPQC